MTNRINKNKKKLSKKRFEKISNWFKPEISKELKQKLNEIQKEYQLRIIKAAYEELLLPILILTLIISFIIYSKDQLPKELLILLLFGILYISVFWILDRIFLFYSSYYQLLFASMRLRYADSSNFERRLQGFHLRYDEFRLRLKKRVRRLSKTFIYDYATSRVLKNIDIAFDSSIKLYFLNIFLNAEIKPFAEKYLSGIPNIRENIINGQSTNSGYINLTTIDSFINSIGKIFIKTKRWISPNIITIDHVFYAWNCHFSKINQNIFNQSKEDIYIHYDKAQERRAEIISRAFEILILLIISIVTYLIVEMAKNGGLIPK
jgi:hypothetical protein